jgi:hypothetical protein
VFTSIDPTALLNFLKINNTSALFQTGTLSISSWNTLDYMGNPRPDATGFVSIGAYEPVTIPIYTQSLRFQSSATIIDIDLPERSYESTYVPAFDIAKLNNEAYESYDNGKTIDKYFCKCSFRLPEEQALQVNSFFRSYRHESFTMTIEGNTTSKGFYPFLPNNGNSGPWLVSAIPIFKGIINEPFRYFAIDLDLRNVGTMPAFTLPDEQWEGDFGFAGVNDMRCPDDLFTPVISPLKQITHSENSKPYYSTRGELADQVISSFDIKMNISKASKFFDQLINVYRSEAFPVVVQNKQFIFGENYGDNRIFYAKLIQDSIVLSHDEFNVFSCKLKLFRTATDIGEIETLEGGIYEIPDGILTI